MFVFTIELLPEICVEVTVRAGKELLYRRSVQSVQSTLRIASRRFLVVGRFLIRI